MVGQEPEEYRPRRAWVEDPDDTVKDTGESADETRVSPAIRDDSGDSGVDALDSDVDPEADTRSPGERAANPRIDDSLFRPGSQPKKGDADTEPVAADSADDHTRVSPDAQAKNKPSTNDPSKGAKSKDATSKAGTSKAGTSGPADAGDDATRVSTFEGTTIRRPSGDAEETRVLGRRSPEETTVLPRASRRRDAEGPSSASSPAETGGARLGQRSRLALLVGAVAAVVVLGLAVGYAAITLNDGTKAGPGAPPASPAGSASADPGSTPTEDSGVVLQDASMLSAEDAKQIDGKRTWKVATTQKGRGDDSPQTACASTEPVDGQPQPQQTFLRTLTASGSKAPAALHQAEAYSSPDEATQAFTLAAKALGGCAMERAYIDSGVYATGLGNQATGVVVKIQDDKSQFRTVVLNRTGRVVNVLDVAQDGKAVDAKGLGEALGAVTNEQCTAAVGLCATNVKVTDGPPPLGGDEPGFLAASDIPPIDGQEGVWSGDTPGKVSDLYSGCEGVEFNTVENVSKREARTYLLADNADAPEAFGVDQVLLTMKKKSAAKDLVSKVEENLASCSNRSLTATVEEPEKFSGTGSKEAKIKGSVTTVQQKVNSSNTANYRVGISRVGNKVVYTFVPTTSDFDFSDTQWEQLNVRAGERASQVK